MKVSELSGELLGLWVAKALSYELVSELVQIGEAALGKRGHVIFYSESGELLVAGKVLHGPWRPHEDWAQGGPIIEREGIELVLAGHALASAGNEWVVPDWLYDEVGGNKAYGPTPLIAAMRAFVASKYGEEVPDKD